jgi:hypothetical protein
VNKSDGDTPRTDDHKPNGPTREPASELNPLSIEQDSGIVKGPAVSSAGRSPGEESRWGVLLAALAPFIIAVFIRLSVSGWHPAPIDAPNLAYSLFALSLAGITRMVSTGEGRRYFYLLVIAGVLQAVLGMYFSGLFNKSQEPSKPRLAGIEQYLNGLSSQGTGVTITRNKLGNIQGILSIVEANDDSPSVTAYIILAGAGLISALIVLRYWAPVVQEQEKNP